MLEEKEKQMQSQSGKSGDEVGLCRIIIDIFVEILYESVDGYM